MRRIQSKDLASAKSETRPRTKTSNIVPGLVLGASFAGVVPAIAITACSGGDPLTNLQRPYGVAAVAYCCFEGGGVADVGFRPDVAGDAPKEAGDAPSETATDAPSDSPEGG